MKIRRILTVCAGIVLILLIVVYSRFVESNAEPDELALVQTEPPLTILAPYEFQEQRKTLQSIGEAYSQIPGNPRVEFHYVSQDNYKKELRIRMDTGKNPDLVICENTMMPALIGMGLFTDLSEYLNHDRIAVYRSNLWGNTRYNGGYYGLPLTCDPYVLYCNMNLLSHAGYTVPKTWKTTLAVCDNVDGLGNYGFAFAGKRQEELTSFYMQMLYSMGGSLRELNGKAGLEVLNYLVTLKNRHDYPSELINWTQEDLAMKFSEGNIAIMAGRLSMTSILNTRQPDFKIRVVPMPSGVKQAYLLHGENIGITTTADFNKAAAFLDYLGQTKTASQLAQGFGTIPVLVETTYQKQKISLRQNDAESYLLNAQAKGSYRSWFDISGSISENIYQLLSAAYVSQQELASQMQDDVRMAIIDQ